MVCPKCNSQNQDGNFCGECGEQIWRCPECGQKEKFGRKVCETKLSKLKNLMADFERKKVGIWRLILNIALATVSVMGGAFSLAYLGVMGYLSALIVAPLIAVVIFVGLPFWALFEPVCRSVRKKAKRDFLILHPEYAERIKKTEGK